MADVLTDFKCEIKVIPLVEWVKRGEKDGNCPPCLMAPLASYYLGALEEASSKQAEKLKSKWDSHDLLTIAAEMDIIKTQVGEDLKKSLIAYDCFAQSYKE